MAAQEIGSLYVGLGFDTAVFDRQIVQIPQRAQAAAEGIKKGFQSAGKELDNFQKSTGATRAAVQNLTFQLNDIGTSLASGGSPLRVLAQQGGQIIQVFQQGGGVRSVMSAFAVSLRGLITPATGAVAAIAAVAVSVGVLTARAVENSNAMREFGVMLKGLGLEGQATAAGLEEAAKRLKDVGLSASDARAALTAATRAGIAPGQAERVVRTGQNLVPVLGENAPTQLIAAITGGIEPLGKMATQLGLITAREMEAAREAAKFGQQLQYIDRWVGLIEQRTKGLNQAALSPMGEAMRKLGTAFSEMLDAASRSSIILGIVDAMTKLAGVLKGVFEMEPPAWFRRLLGLGPNVAGPATGGGAATGAGAGGRGPAYEPEVALELIEHFESGGKNIKNPTSSASGYYQFLDSTWREIAPQVGIDISKYPTAMSASRELQMAAATKLYQQRGFAPWAPYNTRLAAHIGYGAGAGGTGSVLPADQARADFLAARDAQTKALGQATNIETLTENAMATSIRAGRGARGAAMVEAAREGAPRFADDPRGAEAQAAQRLRAQQFLELSQARGRRALAEGGEADRQTTEQLKLQASLFGQSTQEIEKQISLLKIRQQAEAASLDLTDEAVKAREAEAEKLAEANALLARQQTLMQQMREIAGVFENAFSSAFDSIVAGTFKARAFIGGLMKDLGKMIASQAFKKLLGGDDSGGGLLGTLAGKLFGISGLGGLPSDSEYAAINADPSFGGGGVPAFATGGGFRVGGSGSIDSQLVAFRASPGEMVNVTPPGRGGSGGGADVIRIELNPNEGWVSGIADQQIVTRSGQIVQVAVRQSQATVQRNFSGMTAEANARQM